MKTRETKRFTDNGDGTVTDTERNLMWKQTDALQDEGKFMNWFDARDYVVQLNINKVLGYADWRLPTLEEAESLYDENHHIRDVDRFEIFIDPCFAPGGGFTTWTSDEMPFGTAHVFYYRYGHSNLSHKEGITKDTVRAVRDLK
ncbi:MAG: DUF1566 domain-containing protein [Nitrospinales bacterium]